MPTGALQSVREVLWLITPLIGAGLFALAGPRPVVIGDAATFAISATMLLMRVTEARPSRSASATPRWAEISAGARHIMRTAALRQVVLAGMVAMLGFGLIESAGFSVNADGLHRPPARGDHRFRGPFGGLSAHPAGASPCR